MFQCSKPKTKYFTFFPRKVDIYETSIGINDYYFLHFLFEGGSANAHLNRGSAEQPNRLSSFNISMPQHFLHNAKTAPPVQKVGYERNPSQMVGFYRFGNACRFER
jgi:hypothetical protein